MATVFADKQPSNNTSGSTSTQPFFAPSNTIQRKIDKGDATNYLSMINLDEANKSNIISMKQFSNERYLLWKETSTSRN
jgi:hypothetical protein